MKNVTKLTTKSIVLSMMMLGGIAIAAPGDPVLEGDDATLKNVTLDNGRLYQHDGYGAQWALDTGSDGLWFVPKEPVEGTYSAPLKVRNDAKPNTLVIGNNDDTNTTNGYVGIGTANPSAQLDVSFAGANTVDDGLSVLTLLSANNSEADKASDAGFALKNTREDFQWNFRTLEYNDAFTATKSGTGGGEFLVQSPTTDFRDAIVKVAGVTIFEDGHLVTASSRELKTDIQPLDSEAALEAFDKLQPVSYAYKAHKDEAVVGFIAEDVPALVAMPSGKSIDSTEIVAVLTSVLAETRAEMEAMRAEIAELKGMK